MNKHTRRQAAPFSTDNAYNKIRHQKGSRRDENKNNLFIDYFININYNWAIQKIKPFQNKGTIVTYINLQIFVIGMERWLSQMTQVQIRSPTSGGLQLTVTPVLGDSMPLSGLYRHCMHMEHTHRQTHVFEKN